MDKEIRFSKTSRKHKIGKARAMSVIKSVKPKVIRDRDGFDKKLVWIGVDNRGLRLEIVGIDFEEMILIIHVMPISFRRGK